MNVRKHERIIGETAFFCYGSVVGLLLIFNGPDILHDLKESGFVFAPSLLVIGSGLFSMVAPRKRKKKNGR